LTQFKKIQLGESGIYRYFKGTSRLTSACIRFSDRCAADPLQWWTSPLHLALLREVASLRKAVRSRREGATATGMARMGARVGGVALVQTAWVQVRRAAGGRPASSRTTRHRHCGNADAGGSHTIFAQLRRGPTK